jgi:3-oxoacyl-[acyl-carrier protein] reductase
VGAAAVSAAPTYADLADKTAVVTGASRGIGAAVCRMLCANRARVAVVARDRAAIDSLVAELRAAGGEATGVSADMAVPQEVSRMRDAVEAALGPVDILVPFAGGFGGLTPVHEIAYEEWRAVIDANLTSTFLTCRSFLPGMMERRAGAIVTMASNGGRFLDVPLTASYAAAKAGIVMFTRHLAMEVGSHGIRANCVAPATVLSERIRRIMTPERLAEIAAMSPLGRLGVPEDVAAATLFLLSDSAAWLTGVTLDVAGGRVML